MKNFRYLKNAVLGSLLGLLVSFMVSCGSSKNSQNEMMMQMMQEQSSESPANDPRERRSNQGPAGAPQLQKVPEEDANRNILPPPERSEIMTLRKTPFDLRFSEEVRRYFTKIAQDEKKEKRKMERKTEKKK